MSYTKYRSKGIILGGSNVSEASRIYNIFTREFGMIRVKAQGIREIKSKLRPHLQNLFLTDLYLIKGKNGWKVTEAYKIESLSDFFKEDQLKLQLFTRIMFFVKKMAPEEDNNSDLFDIITEGLDFLYEEDFSEEHILNLERIIVLRILNNLGYIKDSQKIKFLLTNNYYDKKSLEETNSIRSFLTEEINKSIKASQL